MKPPRQTFAGTGGRVPALDGIRGMAALMVVVFHYAQGLGTIKLPGLAPLSRLLNAGQTGVDLFFVLSGFLITGILLEAKGTPHFLRNFYVRRALRILPLYYAVIIGCLITGLITGSAQYSFSNTWWYLVFLQNFGTTFWADSIAGPGHFWSLGVEEHFYLFWPFVIMAFSARALPKALLALIAGGILCRVLLLELDYDVFTFSLCRMDALSVGALLAVLMHQPEQARKVGKFCKMTLIGLFILLAVSYPLLSGKALPAIQTIKYTVIALAYAGLVGVAVAPEPVRWVKFFFSIPALRWCGKYSYAIYVFHPFVFYFVMSRMRHPDDLMRQQPALFVAIEFTLCVALTLAVSLASWHLMEKRVLRLKDRFEYHPQPESNTHSLNPSAKAAQKN